MGLITRAELVRADVARRERLEREHGKLQRNLRSHEGDGGKSEKSSAAPGPGLLIPARASISGRFQILTPANAYVASCALSLLAFLSFHAFDAPAFFLTRRSLRSSDRLLFSRPSRVKSTKYYQPLTREN